VIYINTVPHQFNFLAPLPGKRKTSARRVSHTHPLLCFKFCFTLFLLALFYHKKIVSLYLSALSFARMATPIVPPAPAANFYEIKPAY
jgi:hypothetical protein